MASLNKVMLLGNLGRDPELRTTSSGTPVLNFPMATTRRWKERDSDRVLSETDWHRVVVWGRQAEVLAEYLKRGSQVHIEGRLQTRSWTGDDGVTRYVTEVIASRVQMLGRPQESAVSEPTDAVESPPDPAEPTGTEEEVPA